ncbi:MAG: 2,3-bisphosphoglycerate-independent phosphoglycerate mutase [bacterium]
MTTESMGHPEGYSAGHPDDPAESPFNRPAGKTRVVLCILDGFGWRVGPDREYGNAIIAAQPEYFYSLWDRYPHTTLGCSGRDVGLPDGQMGNSEVGHLTIGAGRIVNQELVRISETVAGGAFSRQPAWQDFVARVQRGSNRLHLLGLVSPGGVHSHTDHLYGIVAAAQEAGIEDIFIHAFLDGRDTDPQAGLGYMETLLEELATIGAGRVASVTGRFYAMDRDKRWDRVEKAWRMLVHGEGRSASDPVAAIRDSYAADVTDEFVSPVVITEGDGKPLATVDNGDGVFFWNFRADRARELTWAFNQDDFDGFPRPRRPAVEYLCMTPYDEKLDVPVLFTPLFPHRNLPELFAAAGVTNLRLAETEKYAHVTYFFNGGREEPYPGEERLMIPSPKVQTYDLQPEMSAPAVAQAFGEQIASGKHEVIVVNFANGDMVGHTGDFEAAVQAVKTLDGLLATIVPPVVEQGGTFLITADHGNCDQMLTTDGRPMTAHSLNPVPFVAVSQKLEVNRGEIPGGPYGLADIAPTLLGLLDLPLPAEMTGRSIL